MYRLKFNKQIIDSDQIKLICKFCGNYCQEGDSYCIGVGVGDRRRIMNKDWNSIHKSVLTLSNSANIKIQKLRKQIVENVCKLLQNNNNQQSSTTIPPNNKNQQYETEEELNHNHLLCSNNIGIATISIIPKLKNQNKLFEMIPLKSDYKNQSELSIQILEEEPQLKNKTWFQSHIPREIALELLKNAVIGTFIVRESSTQIGCFALSVRIPGGILHYLIIKSNKGGYKIKGFTKEFSSLNSLITHHSVMPELLPCTLKYNNSLRRNNSHEFAEHELLITK